MQFSKKGDLCTGEVDGLAEQDPEIHAQAKRSEPIKTAPMIDGVNGF